MASTITGLVEAWMGGEPRFQGERTWMIAIARVQPNSDFSIQFTFTPTKQWFCYNSAR